MPLKVGELYATMSVDTKDFNKGIDDARRSFDSLKSDISSGIQSIAKAMVGITTVSTDLGAAVFKIGADYNRLQQSSHAALTTLLGSAEAASAQMDKLDDFARNSPFAKQVFITAQQQLLGFGVAAKDVIPILDAVQNAVAAVGGNDEQVASVTYALAQMQGQGKLTGQTLDQLRQYGIDAAAILGQEMGKTGQEIRDMASKPGGIPADQVFAPLTEGLMKRFGGATDLIRLQMDGALKSIKDAIRHIGSALVAPFIDPKGGGIGVEWANKIADLLHAVAEKAKPFVDLMVERLAPGMERITPALERAIDAVKGWDITKVNTQLDRLSQYGTLLAPVTGALLSIGGASIRGSLGMLVPTINPIVAALGGLVLASPEARSALGDFANSLSPLIPILGQVSGLLADKLIYVIDALVPIAGNLLVAAAELAVAFGSGLVPVLGATLDAAQPFLSVVATLATGISNLPTPILAIVGALIAFKALNMGAAVSAVSVGFREMGTAVKSSAGLRAYNSGLSAASAAMAQVNAATTAAQTQLTRFNAFLKTNALGLAITGVVTAIGWLSGSNQKAKEAQERHTQAVAQFTDVLRENEGALNGNVYEARLNEIVTSGYAAKLDAAGVSVADFTEASLGNAEAQARVSEQLVESMAAGDATINTFTGVSRELERYTKITEDSQEQLRIHSEATRESADANEDAADRARSHTIALGENTSALETNIAAKRDAAEGYMSLRKAQIRAVDSANELIKAAKEGDQVTRDASGAIDLNAESTMRADEALIKFVEEQHKLIDNMIQQGATSEEIDRVTTDMAATFDEAAGIFGYVGDEVVNLRKEMDLLPDRKEMEVWANLQDAGLALNRFYETWNGKRIFMSINTTTPGRINFGDQTMANVRKDGAVVDYFANGGVRENRIAQIAPAGAMRIWAEPETGGEAYIPLALSKRARSLQILDETARRLGRITLPASTALFADGGHATPASIQVGSTAAGRSLTKVDILAIAEAVRAGASEGTRAGISDTTHQVQTDMRAGV